MRNESHDYHPRISRRHLLRGIGATLTLPWLEGLAYADGGHAAVEAGPPRRWAALVANGVVGPDWHAKQTPEGIVFSEVLSPLTPHQQDIIFFDNMRLDSKAPPMNIHRYHYTNMLSGEPVPGKSVRKLATNADYHMARLLGANTVVPVFNLGCRMSSKSIETNFSICFPPAPVSQIVPQYIDWSDLCPVSRINRACALPRSSCRYMKAVTSEQRCACCKLCVTITMVKSFFNSVINSSTFSVATGSREAHGSSIKRISG